MYDQNRDDTESPGPSNLTIALAIIGLAVVAMIIVMVLSKFTHIHLPSHEDFRKLHGGGM